MGYTAENWSSVLLVVLVTGAAITLAAIYLDLRRQAVKPIPPAGCRRLGLEVYQSNLRDQYDSKYSGVSSETVPNGDSAFKVKALCIYPIKSCYPVELGHGEVVRTGMRYDRQFTFAQLTSSVAKEGARQITHQWTFITQRQSAELTKVRTELWIPDPSSPTYSPDAEYVKSEGCIVVSFPFVEDKLGIIDTLERLGAFVRGTILKRTDADRDGPRISFRIPFNPTPERIREKQYPRESMKIWNEYPEALNMGVEIPPEILAKLKYALGISNQLTLFRTDTQRYREVFRCAPKKGEDIEYQPIVGMADAYPLHIINLASVHDVASHLSKKTKLDAIRFRANIYVTGPPPYAEDHWKRIRICSQTFHVSCRTARCTLPNVDPDTAERDRSDPYTTMAAFRKIDPGAAKWPCLGMQMVPMSSKPEEIRVGDEVVVEEIGEHCYIPQGPS